MTAVNATAEALIASVRRRANVPATDDGAAFPRDSDILGMLNEEVQGWLVPLILKAREGHFLARADIALAAGQSTYLIPQRAAGADVSFVQLVDSSGALVSALAQEDLEVLAGDPGTSGAFGALALYSFLGNQIFLSPAPSAAGNFLRVWYPQRPNQLVASTATAGVTGTSVVGGNFRVSFSGTAPATFLTALAYECVHSNPGFEVVTLGTANAVASTYVQFPGAVPAGINAGDYLCLEDTAPVVTNLPADLAPLLCQWVALKLIEYRGDGEQLKRAQSTFQSTLQRSLEFLGKRDQLSHRKIVPARNRRRWPPFTVR